MLCSLRPGILFVLVLFTHCSVGIWTSASIVDPDQCCQRIEFDNQNGKKKLEPSFQRQITFHHVQCSDIVDLRLVILAHSGFELCEHRLQLPFANPMHISNPFTSQSVRNEIAQSQKKIDTLSLGLKCSVNPNGENVLKTLNPIEFNKSELQLYVSSLTCQIISLDVATQCSLKLSLTSGNAFIKLSTFSYEFLNSTGGKIVVEALRYSPDGSATVSFRYVPEKNHPLYVQFRIQNELYQDDTKLFSLQLLTRSHQPNIPTNLSELSIEFEPKKIPIHTGKVVAALRVRLFSNSKPFTTSHPFHLQPIQQQDADCWFEGNSKDLEKGGEVDFQDVYLQTPSPLTDSCVLSFFLRSGVFERVVSGTLQFVETKKDTPNAESAPQDPHDPSVHQEPVAAYAQYSLRLLHNPEVTANQVVELAIHVQGSDPQEVMRTHRVHVTSVNRECKVLNNTTNTLHVAKINDRSIAQLPLRMVTLHKATLKCAIHVTLKDKDSKTLCESVVVLPVRSSTLPLLLETVQKSILVGKQTIISIKAQGASSTPGSAAIQLETADEDCTIQESNLGPITATLDDTNVAHFRVTILAELHVTECLLRMCMMENAEIQRIDYSLVEVFHPINVIPHTKKIIIGEVMEIEFEVQGIPEHQTVQKYTILLEPVGKDCTIEHLPEKMSLGAPIGQNFRAHFSTVTVHAMSNISFCTFRVTLTYEFIHQVFQAEMRFSLVHKKSPSGTQGITGTRAQLLLGLGVGMGIIGLIFLVVCLILLIRYVQRRKARRIREVHDVERSQNKNGDSLMNYMSTHENFPFPVEKFSNKELSSDELDVCLADDCQIKKSTLYPRFEEEEEYDDFYPTKPFKHT